MKVWLLVVMVNSATPLSNPTIIDGYQSKDLCEVAGTKLTKTLKEMVTNNQKLDIKSRCMETTKSEYTSPLGSSPARPSEHKEW